MPMLSAGALVGDHRVVRHAATGAMSEVYEGRHATSEQPVAIKVLHPELCAQKEVVARFLIEGQALQHLQHPRVVAAFACGALPEGPPFMILEWLPEDLHQALSRAGGALPPESVVRVARQLAEALLALHERGLVHRDLKPSNVLLASEGLSPLEVKLADLGLAKVLPDEAARANASTGRPSPLPVSTGSSTLLGTWDYMAPEQWVQSKSVDAKADVYALGILLFQMLVGRLPFVAERQQDLMYLHLLTPPPLNQLEGRAPPATRALIARMLEKKTGPRATMREVQECLAQLS